MVPLMLIMKKEELIFDMSDDNNEFMEESTTPLHCGGTNEQDEGCCINSDPATGGVRRVKSTPNLLQIPSPSRNRKKSDDSAVGSAEETESDKSSADNSPSDTRLADRIPPFHRSRSTVTNKIFPDRDDLPLSFSAKSRMVILRPPSVVVSDHDLCQHHGEETFLTLEDLEADLNTYHQRRRISDASSTCSSLSFSELDFQSEDIPETEESVACSNKISRWRTVRILAQVTPFLQTYKDKRVAKWVQLAGHQGNFKAGWQQGTILKKFCGREKDAFDLLKEDPLKPFVPQYYGVVKDADIEFLQLEDLLGQFNNPCVMDCKLGVRTYLEEELMKAKEKPKLRKDMYEKMCQIDENAPTPEEHRVHGVTKPRYMVWRETISTTATMGFRIEGIRKSDGTSSKDFKTVRSQEKVRVAFSSFMDGYSDAIQKYLDRLYALRNALKQSQFFATHEVIGSSLLFVHDSTSASVWMIDFAKTIPLPDGLSHLQHDIPWTPGNHEDGYLVGLSNLISMFEEIRPK